MVDMISASLGVIVNTVALLGDMADGFDVVAVGGDHEGAVIARMVMRTLARFAVVLGAGCDRGGVKCVDLLAAVGGEGDMDRAGDRAFRAQPPAPSIVALE